MLGFLDAAYLTIKHYFDSPLSCSISEASFFQWFDGCEKVTTSQYAVIFKIPLALLGVIYYLGIFILAIIYLETKDKRILLFFPFFTAIGFLVSLWLVYLQVFALKALCLYCLISAFTSTILFIFGLFVVKLLRKVEKTHNS